MHFAFDQIQFDFRDALRAFRRHRVFTVTAVSMLAIGIGMNVAVFTVVDASLMRCCSRCLPPWLF
jgi:hypothetical protein